jgi:prevent-host-death family protein
MELISIVEAERNLEDVLNLVANGKQRFLLADKQRPMAALLSTEDLELLLTLDDKKQAASKISFQSLRGTLRERIGTLADAGKRVVVTRNGTELAALVPVRDVETLVGLDDDIDLQAAKRLLDQQLGRE